MILYIAAGDSVAAALLAQGCSPVCAFREAMCQGEITGMPFDRTFCRERASAYGLRPEEYRSTGEELRRFLPDAEEVHLYFDGDMFCAVNTLTLLTFLERERFAGHVEFFLVQQDGTARVIRHFPLSLGGFSTVYQHTLLEKKPAETGVAHLDEGLRLYLEYRKKDNALTAYIRQHPQTEAEQLCRELLMRFPAYGAGDTALRELIRKEREEAVR